MKIKQQVQELFPTPLWILDVLPVDAAPFNAKLRAEVEKISSPRPKVPSGSNWQTPQDLHTRPAFAEFVKLVETAARGVARFLQRESAGVAAASASSRLTVGSSPYTSSPKGASAIARRIAGEGSVTVSLLVAVHKAQMRFSTWRALVASGAALSAPSRKSSPRVVGAMRAGSRVIQPWASAAASCVSIADGAGPLSVSEVGTLVQTSADYARIPLPAPSTSR